MSQPRPGRLRRWARRIAKLILILAVGLVIAFFAARAVLFALHERELRSAIAETDAQDPGWRWEELEAKRPAVPAAENAARVLEQLQQLRHPEEWEAVTDFRRLDPGRMIDRWNDRDARWLVWIHEYPSNCQAPPEVVEGLEWLLGRNAAAVRSARSLQGLSRGRYPLAIRPDVVSTPEPVFDGAHFARWLLYGDVLLAQERGQSQRVWSSLQALMSLNRAIEDGPGHTVHSVRVLALRSTARAVERVLGNERNPGHLGELQDFFTRQRSSSHLSDCLRSERALAHLFLSRLAEGEPALVGFVSSDPPGQETLEHRLLAYIYEPWVRHDHAVYLRGAMEAVRIAQLPHPQRAQAIRAFANRRQEEHTWFRTIAFFHIGRLEQMLRKELEVCAMLESARVGIACERFRQERGAWPENLDDLVPEFLDEVPADVYDGQPLIYTRLPDGILICPSGAEPDHGPRTLTWNERTFRLWDPDQRRQPPPVLEEPDLPGFVD